MESDDIRVLCGNWLQSKEDELKAIERRHAIEVEICQHLNVDTSRDGTSNLIDGDIQVRVVTKLKREVNVLRLRALAEEYGLIEEIKTLFNWIPEFNRAFWHNADPSVTEALREAIKVSPQKPVVEIRKFP